MARKEPSREELLALLIRARESIEASEEHWSAVPHLVGDKRFQRQQREMLDLLDAMRRRVESYGR